MDLNSVFESEVDGDEDAAGPRGNILKLWGNQQTMNLNSMLYSNVVQSPYFKANLIELKTYHEVIDEIYYKVEHLEPWERGSRKVGGHSGMCGGVRGVGGGGIVSTAYCLLYKLFTLKLTRKQLKGLLDHPDSPFIRALGFMYIRYCLPPEDLWRWYAPYLDDPEELDVKAGGGCTMTIGSMLEQWLTKLDWFSTLFPRLPVVVQKKLEDKMRTRSSQKARTTAGNHAMVPRNEGGGDSKRCDDKDRREGHSRDHHRHHKHRHRSRSHERHRSRSRGRESSFERDMKRARERYGRSVRHRSRSR